MTNLVLNNLRVSYAETEILKGVSLTVPKGTFVGLLGPSGCGKTTLLRTIAGLEQAAAGEVALNGRVLSNPDNKIDVAPNERDLGFVFQSYALWPHMTVRHNVAYGLKVRNINRAEQEGRVSAVLKNVGLDGLGDRFPHELSGGQQQRVALARALVYDPAVILLDEPLSNLDAKLRHEARAWLRSVIEELGVSAICVTHDQEEAMALADTVVVMRNGEIVQSGTPQQLYEEPESAFVAEFFGVSNRFHGILEQLNGDIGRIRIGDNVIEAKLVRSAAIVTSGCAVDVVMRASAMTLSYNETPDALSAQLTSSRYFGTHWEYRLHAGEDTVRVFGPEDRVAGTYWIKPHTSECWAFASAAM